MKKLTPLQAKKYFCTTFLDEIKEKGQQTLLNSRVLVVGAGGLASQTLLYLSSMGVGTIGVVDFDKVSIDNLPRQILFGENDVGMLKVDVAKRRLEELNKDVRVVSYPMKFDEFDAKYILPGYDIVLDCVDNFETKFLLNDTCLSLGIPLVLAGVSDFKGQVMMVTSKSKKDFKSLFKETDFKISKKDKDKDRGVYPLAVSMVSNIACNEAIKYLLKLGDPLIDQMIIVDALKNKIEKFEL